MDLQEAIYTQFAQSFEAQQQALESLPPYIEHAAKVLFGSIASGGKVICIGNGTSAHLSQYFSTLLSDRMDRERPGLPAFSLNADAPTILSITHNDSYHDVFSKQITALGNPGDVLFVIANKGNTSPIIQAIQAAHERKIAIIALTTPDAKNVSSLTSRDDTEIKINLTGTARVQECQITVIHTLVDLLERQLFGYED
ncbi:SIS domain-containing protein [Marinomonas mediterranea]|jgi:phosphoheptose isomerase (EC 5.3.1.-)|uniref:Sugar isomerase (SIS) n=1 Tax=Marinomonas mediterranea (strain ATCC 700492 / JCM 21426 / NBRC 103028 / MMB-1) TaxID=717774 RepID=F2JU70_MARM1|nr:SIS domain-containing protein [Marinomonas mediterranea]ADZ91582.1 sugar isomerase (SIS) [Marinomonas mediterranea MMB-1]WCN09544.1 SIS domain-containing protein [Marinomonas mediterranea]WCN13623.1 SIS domain-containing protein [Marinomonas mediterranea]WCN17686.1 SIS domain-containing protein [Marinomonas mediterranea MMB-1]